MNSAYSSVSQNIKEFEEYAFSFFGENGIEDLGATREQISLATVKVVEYCIDSGEMDFEGGFSNDICLIKEILIKEFHLSPKKY